jgi:outer membrane protein assembly factor BamB
MWTPRRRPAHEHLNRYWNALNRGAPPEELARLAAPLDPTVIAAIDRARALHRRRRPDPAFATRLEQTLMDAFATAPAGTTPLRPPSPGHSNGRTAPRERWRWLPALPVSKERRRWAMAQFATALLLIVTLLGIYFSFLRPENHEAVAPVGGTATPVTAPAPAPSVPMFRGNAARTGVMPGPGPAGTPAVRWRFHTGEGIIGSPAIVDGVAYVGRGYAGPGATRDRPGALYAIDTATGAERWEFATAAPIETSSVVDGGSVYVGDAAGTLYAIDAASGAEQWRLSLGGQAGEAVVSDGVVYIATTGDTTVFVPVVAVADGAVFVAGTRQSGTLYAIETKTGKERWRSDGFSSDHAAYYALDAATGTPRWEFRIDGGAFLNGAVSGGTLFFGDATNGILYAVDTATGQERWRYAAGAEFWDATSPAVADGAVFAGTKFGEFFALDAATGAERWRVKLDTNYLATSPAVVGDIVYIACMSGIVVALAAADGSEAWRYDIAGASQMHSSPAVVGGVIYVGTYENGYDGSLYGLAAPPTATPAAPPAATPAVAPGQLRPVRPGIAAAFLAFGPPADLPPAPAVLGLLRTAYDPGATTVLGPDDWPTLRYVEAGTITFRLEGPASVARMTATGEPGPAAPVAAGEEVALRPGDAIFLPAGTPHRIRNDGAEPAVLLIVSAMDAQNCPPCPAAPPAGTAAP